jgi:L-alanine-DL-glutamate epimerase-like enolase superfamily enzyme
MHITEVSAIPFAIPLRHPVLFSTGRLTSAEHVLITIVTDSGTSGFAEAIPRPMVYGETVASVMEAVQEIIRPQLLGKSVGSLERVRFAMSNLVGNHTAKGATEMAVFDALGKSLGASCHALLGGYAESMECTAILGFGSPQHVVSNAAEISESHGVTSFKVKVGTNVRHDVAVVLEVRAAFPDATIYVDANHGYSGDDALRFVRSVEDASLLCIEEPCPHDDTWARRRLVDSASTRVLGDESCPTPSDVVGELSAGRSNMVSIKMARTGILSSLAIRDYCDLAGFPVMVGSQGDSALGTRMSVAFAAAAPTTSARPAELGYFLELEGDICTEPLEISEGRMQVPAGPGFGFDIDENALDRYRMR